MRYESAVLKVWSWDNSPPELAAFSNHAGDEDFIFLVPRAVWAIESWFWQERAERAANKVQTVVLDRRVEYDGDRDGWLLVAEVGDVLLIGAHA